jgi:hypothetical protein
MCEIVKFKFGLVCAKRKGMKRVVGKVNRSGVYYLMTTVAPADEKRSARFDVWGAVIVVGLLMIAAGLARLLLSM